MTGFRLVPGSWKIMPMRLPRTSRMADSGSRSKSCPSRCTEPDTIRPESGNSRAIDNAVMDLPQPDSPSSAKVSPRATENETPSTARTTPSLPDSQVRRFSTCSRAGGMAT